MMGEAGHVARMRETKLVLVRKPEETRPERNTAETIILKCVLNRENDRTLAQGREKWRWCCEHDRFSYDALNYLTI